MIFSRYLAKLKNDGQLILQEPILLRDLSNTVCPIFRKEEELASLLKLAGFINVTVKDVSPVTDQDLKEFFHLWGVSQKRLDEGMISRLSDGKRKACKGCTCGREESDEEENGNVFSLDLMEDVEQEVIEVDPSPKENSGYGSCSLGDAFRCSTCPYIGMPAFNEGDKIRLGGMFEIDDIDDF
ncbi:hypothetical protein [Parasitella parasitica]|uniref:Anamorsin homolog n=1 Tax=Parasitella parasitica TaxID=35722 RepID=A0A0B7NH43_9FUNG|nr:hypothetical protein [Parasitella parasitica]